MFHPLSAAASRGVYFPQPCTVFQRKLCGLHVQLCPLVAQLSPAVWEPHTRSHTHLYSQREGAPRGFPAADWSMAGAWAAAGDSLSKSLNGHPMGGGFVDQALRSWAFVVGWSMLQRHFGNILTNLTYPQDCWTVEQSHWCWWKRKENKLIFRGSTV